MAEARQALLRSKEELKTVLTSIPDYLWSRDLDSEGRLIRAYTSPVVEKITGRPPEFYEEGMEKWLATIHPDDLPRLQKTAASIGAGETSQVTEEYRIVRPDGTVRWVSDNTEVRRMEGRTRIAGVVSDITERKLAEEARRQSEQRFHTTFENVGMGIALLNLDGRPLKSNLAFREMLGYSEEELLGMQFTEFTHPEDRDRDWALSRGLSEGKLNRFEVEKRYVKKDGRVVWGHLTASAVKDIQGRPEYVIAMVQDITDQVRAEEALRQSEQFNWEVIHGAREGVIVYDREFRYQAWNPFVEEMTGVRASQILGKRPWEMFPHTKKHGIEMLLQRALAGETVQSTDLYHEPGDNVKSVWTSATFSPHYDHSHKITGVIGLVHDITERKQAELAVQESERLLSLFVQHAPAAIAMLDREMRYLVVSRRWMTDLDLGSRDILGLSHYDVFPEIPERWKDVHRRCLAGAVEWCEEDSFPRPDGTLEWVRWEVHPWRKGNDEIGGLIIFAEVITERKKAQTAIAEGEEKFRKAFMTGADAFYITRLKDGEILEVNDQFTDIFG